MDINFLVKLTRKAWSLNILALLDEGVPARQAPLLARIGAGRTAFAASLDHLVQLGLLERNPGHGHPLRPEYRLTPAGVLAAKMAGRVMRTVPDTGTGHVLRRSWSAPVLALTARPQRFSAIRDGLGQITDRALSQSLGALEDANWLSRDLEMSARRPFPIYQAINTGALVSQAIGIAPAP